MKLITSMIFSLLILTLSVSGGRRRANEFTYQGKLTDSGTPSPTYDFEFRLCTAESAGNCSLPPPAGVLLNSNSVLAFRSRTVSLPSSWILTWRGTSQAAEYF